MKTLKIGKFFVFCHFWVFLFPKNRIYIFINDTVQRMLAFLNPFNIQIHDIYRKSDKIAIKRPKLESFAVFTTFGVSFESFWGSWGQL